MKRSYLAAVTLAAATWLTGCGGGGGGGAPPPPADKFTRAVVNIDWPERSRNIGAPSSALSLVITIKGARENGTDYGWTINRDVGTAASTKRYVSPTAEVKVGTWPVTMAFHAQADGQGPVVATGGAQATIAEDGTGLDNIAITGVIATVEVPAGQTVPTGTKTDLVFSAKDANGTVIAVTPGSVKWQVTAGADKLQFVNGQAEAIGNGTATVTATVDNKTSAPATVQAGATTGTLVVNARDSGNPTGTPIKPAVIQIFQGATKLDEKTSASGTQTFTNVAPGEITIKVAVTGYQPGESTATVTVGASTTKDVLLVKQGTLIVNVKDPFGALVTGQTVQLFQGGTKVAEKVSASGAETFTNLAPGATEIKVPANTGFYEGTATTTVVSGQTVTKDVSITPRGKPQASASAPRQTGLAGNSATYVIDIAVMDEFGKPLPGLDASAFTVPPVTVGNTTYTFTRQSVVPMDIPDAGPYSAFIALDHSESLGGVGGSDPQGARFQAAKTFFGALGSGDHASFGYFPATEGSTNMKIYPEIGFVSNGSLYYPKVDELSKRRLIASTPLYNATNQAIDFTASLGPTANKAVVVFTDGEITDKTKRDATIANAKAKGVKIYMVGLGAGTDLAELSLVAEATGGSVMYATDAAQLVSFYNSLGSILSGSGKFYRTTWTVTKSSGNLNAGEAFAASARVTLPDATVLQAPFYIVVR